MAIDRVLTKTVMIDAPASQVWNALTNPEVIREWLFGTNVISDWNVGSQILFTGNWQGTTYKDKGTILKYEVEKTFQYNYWSSFSGLPDRPENYSIITFELTPTRNATTLTLTQSNFPDEAVYEHTGKNWDGVLGAMKKLLEQ